MTSDSYCPAPFVSKAFGPDGRSRPCCAWTGVGLDAVGTKELIGMGIRGEWHRGCESCRELDMHGTSSLRMYYISLFGRPITEETRHLDIHLGNLCNMRCRICSSNHSTKWANDSKAMGLRVHPLTRHDASILDGTDLSRVEIVRFQGGEPLLEQQAVSGILGRIAEAAGGLGNVSVQMTTNGTAGFEPELGDMLRSCKGVIIRLSMDGTEHVNAYQRTDCDWDALIGNALDWQANLPDSFRLNLATTWSVINVVGFGDLMRFASEHLPRYRLTGDVVRQPRQLSLRNLPSAGKELVLSRLVSGIGTLDATAEDIRLTIANEVMLKQDTDARFVTMHIRSLDRLRGTDFRAIDPDLCDTLGL